MRTLPENLVVFEVRKVDVLIEELYESLDK
jgi:hypothetical protein